MPQLATTLSHTRPTARNPVNTGREINYRPSARQVITRLLAGGFASGAWVREANEKEDGGVRVMNGGGVVSSGSRGP
jgi:hypothetical protein